MMQIVRYIGLDVHRDTISAAVLDSEGKVMMQSVLATRAAAILDFLHGIKGTLHVTFEEGNHSAGFMTCYCNESRKLWSAIRERTSY